MEFTIIASTAAGVKGAALISAMGTVLAAVIIGVCGGLITGRYNRQKDRQEKELQYRSHAIELAKLDHERKLKLFEKDPDTRMRPGILDFLANYRDLKELDFCNPAELYTKIKQQRISASLPADASRPEI
jgi:hypothetical protein